MLLNGLLNVRPLLIKDFENTKNVGEKVNLHLVTFLCSDIFEYLLSHQMENDKVDSTSLNWTDRGLLLRIVEERFYKSGKNLANANSIWYKYFDASVKGIQTKTYLANAVLPRPRDMIFLSKAALNVAIDRAHSKITEDDILYAEQQYSKHAVNALINENVVLYPQLENFLYELVGGDTILSFGEVWRKADEVGVPSQKINTFIEHLTEQWFFGLEVSRGRFEYLYEDSYHKRLKALSLRYVNSARAETRRYRVNKAFCYELSLNV